MAKNMANELNNSEIISLILRESPGYIFWKDLNSVYRGCNQNGAILYGVSSPEELVGKTDFDFNQEFADEFVKQDQIIIKTKKLHISENDVITGQKSGKHLILRTEKKPLFNANGEVIGVVGHALDVTAEREAEKLRIENEKQKAEITMQEQFKKCLDDIQHTINNYKIHILDEQLGIVINDTLFQKLEIELSRREREVLYFLSLHKSPKEIAKILSILDKNPIMPKTIQSIIDKQLYTKFGVYSIGEVIDLASRKKLIPFLLN